MIVICRMEGGSVIIDALFKRESCEKCYFPTKYGEISNHSETASPSQALKPTGGAGLVFDKEYCWRFFLELLWSMRSWCSFVTTINKYVVRD